jgi:hypothetical protein
MDSGVELLLRRGIPSRSLAVLIVSIQIVTMEIVEKARCAVVVVRMPEQWAGLPTRLPGPGGA